jgi:hypothetical protein
MMLAVLTAPNADTVDCGGINDRYTANVAKLTDTLHAYEKCIAASDKRNDCAAEIQALDAAHDDFADAVADAIACQ